MAPAPLSQNSSFAEIGLPMLANVTNKSSVPSQPILRKLKLRYVADELCAMARSITGCFGSAKTTVVNNLYSHLPNSGMI